MTDESRSASGRWCVGNRNVAGLVAGGVAVGYALFHHQAQMAAAVKHVKSVLTSNGLTTMQTCAETADSMLSNLHQTIVAAAPPASIEAAVRHGLTGLPVNPTERGEEVLPTEGIQTESKSSTRCGHRTRRMTNLPSEQGVGEKLVERAGSAGADSPPTSQDTLSAGKRNVERAASAGGDFPLTSQDTLSGGKRNADEVGDSDQDHRTKSAKSAVSTVQVPAVANEPSTIWADKVNATPADPEDTYQIGTSVDVYWTSEKMWYNGKVIDSHVTKKKGIGIRNIQVRYGDGGVFTHTLTDNEVRQAVAADAGLSDEAGPSDASSAPEIKADATTAAGGPNMVPSAGSSLNELECWRLPGIYVEA